MSKFCMFCGNQLPDIAQFCPACGQKQQAVETKKAEAQVEEIDEEASDEMNLLSQFGYIAPKQPKKKTPPFKPTVKIEEEKKEPVHVEKQIHKAQDIQEQKIAEKQVEQPKVQPPKFEQQEEIKPKIEPKVEESKLDNTKVEEIVVKEQKQAPIKKISRDQFVTIPKSQFTTIKKETVENNQETNTQETEEKPATLELKKEQENPVVYEQQEKAEIKQEEQPSRPQSRRRRSVRNHEQVIPFQPTEQKQNENIIPTKSTAEEKYELPEDFSISNDTEEKEVSLEEMMAEMDRIAEEERIHKEQEAKKNKDGKNKPEAIASKKKESKFFPFRKKTTTSDDVDDENFNTELVDRTGGSSMMSKGTLYADEISDNQKKNIKIEDDDIDEEAPRERRRNSEGRKQVSTNTQKRRRSSRSSDINKKIYNIEQDLSALDPEEKEYDGYYENVLPVDHDQIQKKKLDPKYILIALGCMALIGIAVAMIMFFLNM